MSILYINAKCSDLCYAEFEGIEHNGFVPDIVALEGGDYLGLKIDNETGQIINWKPLTVASFKEACGIEEDDE